jgi:hypothetical protein
MTHEDGQITQFELERLERIKRNRAMLATLEVREAPRLDLGE